MLAHKHSVAISVGTLKRLLPLRLASILDDWKHWLLVDWRCPVNYSKQETTLAKTEVRHQACSQSLSTLMLTFHVFFSQNCFSQHNSRYFDLLLEMKRKNTASSSDFNLILDISTFISKWKSEKSPSCNNFFLQWDVKFFFSMELDVSLRMNFPLVLCNNGCSAFLSLLSGRKRRPTASAIFLLFTHLAAGCQQPEMNLCSSGTWTESFFRGREREGRHTVQPVLLHCSPPSLLCWCRHCCCCCFQFLFVLNCCLCIRGQKVWVLFLFFFFQVPVLQLGFCFLARFN